MAKRSTEGAPRLEADERASAQESRTHSASVTYEVIRRTGERELRRPAQALAWSGLAAGLSMGFSFLTQGLIASHLTPGSDLLVKLGYPIGFLIVILGSQQLFTENTLTAVIPLLARRSGAALRAVARLWIVVLAANLIGAFLFASAISIDGLFDPATVAAFERIGSEALARPWGEKLLLAIFAGWLIAIMVWMLPAAGDAGVFVIVLVTYVVGLGGMPHIVAGSVDVFYLVADGHAGAGRVLVGYTLPTLLGNVIGGVALVSALNHAQVVAGDSH